MSNNAKILDQPIVPQTPIQHPSPIGIANKEMGSASPDISEFVRPAGPEGSPNLTQEVVESGVKVPTDKPFLTSAHKELGMDHAGPDVTLSTQPSSIRLPMSEEEVAKQLKTGQNDDSIKGLAKLIQKVIAWGLRNS